MSAATHLGKDALGEFEARQKAVRSAHPDRAFATAVPHPDGTYSCAPCGAKIFRDDRGAWAHGIGR